MDKRRRTSPDLILIGSQPAQAVATHIPPLALATSTTPTATSPTSPAFLSLLNNESYT
jgi:hypothetical protein